MAGPVTRISIPISKPVFGDEERRAVQAPLETGWVVQGPHVERFEELVASYTGAPHAVAVSSGSTALHAAIAALGVGPGDEVVIPGFTWVSTANAVEHTGGRAVFCDVELDTFNASAGAFEAAVTPRTVGIVPVHLFGLCADLEPILGVARRHGLWVLEDAACALGATYAGRHAGTLGDVGVLSFHPRKSITTGEGGMVITPRGDLADRVRSLRDHGASRSDHEREDDDGFLLSDYGLLGFNFRLTDIQGALGCAQMTRVPWILERRRELAARYDEALAGLGWLRTPVVRPEAAVHAYQAYVSLFAPEEPTLRNAGALHAWRNRVMARLDERGIATRQGTHAAALQHVYTHKYGIEPGDVPNSYLADRLSLALPLFPQLTEADQDAVVEALGAALGD